MVCKITFAEKLDEQPGVTAGDVIVILKEQPHARFKRKGVDLYIEKSISLLEALGGFELEIGQLDGRTMIFRSAAGEVVSPVKYDPFTSADDNQEWEVLENTDCTLEDTTRPETTDMDANKQACTKGQLRGKGIGCFVTRDGTTTFKQGTRAECLAASTSTNGATMYVVDR